MRRAAGQEEAAQGAGTICDYARPEERSRGCSGPGIKPR